MKPLLSIGVLLCILGAFTIILSTESMGLPAVKMKSLCDVHYPSDDRIEWKCLKLRGKDTPRSLFGDHWQDILRFNRMDRRHFFGGISIKIPEELKEIEDFTPLPKTYPPAAEEAKFILVDQAEMFLGAYEYGKLVFSYPVAVGVKGHQVPKGTFKIDAIDRHHQSNLYTVEEIGRPYPMHYGLRFYIDKSVDGWPSYWIHGRDVPGYPASHGCLGLYDEEMQSDYYAIHDMKVMKPYYHELTRPFLDAAKRLYLWAIKGHEDSGKFHKINYGPKMLIIGDPPL